MRDNVGGALDFAKYFLGLFLGQNQYAYDLFRQDNYNVQRTPIGKVVDLSRYQEMAIFTNDKTQSTAEVITAAFKRFKLARVIGTSTRGWGTVENTYPLETQLSKDEKYSLFLVNNITLRDDGEPIEGRGVTPDIDITKKNWQNNLDQYFRLPSLISAITRTINSPPLK